MSCRGNHCVLRTRLRLGIPTFSEAFFHFKRFFILVSLTLMAECDAAASTARTREPLSRFNINLTILPVRTMVSGHLVLMSSGSGHTVGGFYFVGVRSTDALERNDRRTRYLGMEYY